MPRLDLCADRIQIGSNASSVMLKSVSRTGTIRFLLQINSVRADCIGMISSVPRFRRVHCWIAVDRCRVNDRFERGELRMNADLNRVCILVRKFELIGRVDLRLELDRFDRRTFEPQNLRAIAARRAIGVTPCICSERVSARGCIAAKLFAAPPRYQDRLARYRLSSDAAS